MSSAPEQKRDGDTADTRGVELGRYRLIRPLGRGGMGEVHLARDSSLDRHVAIKFIAPERLGDEDARRRLIREARAAASLDHSGICAVYETGETDDGRAFVVMQYVEGEPLTEVLRRGLLPVREALVLCARIAEALQAAHTRGIAHRDLKPANVIITPSGHPKLVDFGLAKLMAAPADADTVSTATSAGIVLGTAGYMSPEQAQQRPVDGRSDLFSLGALLFECLTGTRAFEAPTPLETLAKVIHWHPPEPSRLRSELDERHDELCRRLLAKEPADRFQSADEVVGAIRLLTGDTSRTGAQGDPTDGWKIGRTSRRSAALVLTTLLATLVTGLWIWSRGDTGLPAAPRDAQVWYTRGTDALREGAYYTATQALEKAIEIFPSYTLAYARLAEARAELDDQRGAQESLLRVVSPPRLVITERLRLDAVRALVLRDVDTAIATYTELTRMTPEDAGAWLDLGRAQEAAGLSSDARGSYERAIAADRQYAPAFVRLGGVEALGSRREEALAAFERAEQLYRAAVDLEGQTEVLLRRGSVLDSFGELKSARENLERALALATSTGSAYQQLRARLSLSSVTASEGRLEEARRSASAAVDDATRHELDSIAADGLIELASVMQASHLAEAEVHVRRALQLAERRGARRTAMRAKVQLAAIYERQHRYDAALQELETALPFLREHRYRRFELLGLSIATRAHSGLDSLDEARRLGSSVLEMSEKLEDQGQIALAAGNLAGVTAALGNYPAALRLRLRAEEIHKRQGDNDALPYDLANRADLLIRLGRADDADVPLQELEAGISAKIDSFVTRQTRALFFRAFASATQQRCADARPFLRRLDGFGPERTVPGILGPAVARYCDALDGRPTGTVQRIDGIDPPLLRERVYWLAASYLNEGDWESALKEAESGLELLGTTSNDELRWRLAAVGAAAARETAKTSMMTAFLKTARDALSRLQAGWGEDFATYARRPDLAALRNRAGVS